MVDADGVEVLFHPLHPLVEPATNTRTDLGLPSVCGEPPVMSQRRIGVGGRSRLEVEIEQVGVLCGFGADAVDADGHVALQRHARAAGIVGSSLQLQLQVVLDVIDESGGEWSSKFSVRLKPPLVFVKPMLELLCGQQLLATLGKDVGHILALHAMDGLVVGLRLRVQLALLAAVGDHLLAILQFAQLFEVEIVWVQGKARCDVIGIGVVPAAVGGGVVDGQQLDHLHARSHSPVHHVAQVAEVAHAPGVLAT